MTIKLIMKTTLQILKTLKTIAWNLVPWCLICLLIVGIATLYHANIAATNTAAITQSTREFLTKDRMNEFHESIIHSNDAAQIMANTYARVGISTQVALDKHVSPGIDILVLNLTKSLHAIEANTSVLLATANRQLDRNGDNIATNLQSSNRAIERADNALDSLDTTIQSLNRRISAPEIDQMLSDLAATGRQVRVTSEDPEILAALKTTLQNTANTTGNLDHTTKLVDTYVENQLFPKPPRGFWAKFKNGLKVTAGWVGVAGKGFYLINLAK
jgi:hypothetical protein